uniref:Uncharacterized protein n=1 Tax=Arundo donax TaxID=35708 RepID=A0A0A9D689_ARUDO
MLRVAFRATNHGVKNDDVKHLQTSTHWQNLHHSTTGNSNSFTYQVFKILLNVLKKKTLCLKKNTQKI